MTSELKELLQSARDGDQSAFAMLLSRYSPLIEARLKKLRIPQIAEEDVKDLRQEAYVSFYRALTHYNVDQDDVDFGLYAKICIDRGLITALRAMKHLSEAPVLPLDVLEEFENTDVADNPAAQLVEQEDFKQLYSRVRRILSPYENEVWGLYVSGRTAADIAQRTGHEEKSIHNAIYRIRKKLRSALSDSNKN